MQITCNILISSISLQIVAIGDASSVQDVSEYISKHGLNCEITQLSETQFIMPGFIDCHIHAPQMPNIGLGLGLPLLDWLDTFTFPLETEYKNVDFASKVYDKVVVSRNYLNSKSFI